jgi:hypothetical protein
VQTLYWTQQTSFLQQWSVIIWSCFLQIQLHRLLILPKRNKNGKSWNIGLQCVSKSIAFQI